MSEITHDVWVEVDLAALKHNFAQVKGALHQSTRVMAVVKGNGFGHGYIEPSRAFVEAGADYLAVTRLDEALVMRNEGIDAPILVFAPILPQNAEAALAADLDLTVTSLPLVEAISRAAQRLGKTAPVWVKIDTGMCRFGLLRQDAMTFIERANSLRGIKIAGIYTHFATAIEAALAPSREQLNVFLDLLRMLQAAGIDYGMASAANSAAILRLPDSHLDIVRPGTLLYGQYPSQHVPHTLALKPTWTLKARICEIREVPKGSKIGYGSEYTTTRRTRTAVIPVGYSEGFTMVPEGPVYRQSLLKFAAKKMKRSLSVQVGALEAPVLGRVAMQTTVIDVTDVPQAQVGHEVTIRALRIPISPRVPRVYLSE